MATFVTDGPVVLREKQRMEYSTCQIVVGTDDKGIAKLRDVARRMHERPLAAAISVVLPRPGMHDDRTLMEISIDSLHLRLPTFRGWLLGDVTAPGLAREIDILADRAYDQWTGKLHEDLLTKHAAAAILIGREYGRFPFDPIEEDDGAMEIEVCLDPDARPIFWVDTHNDGEQQILVSGDDLDAAAGPMPIPCYLTTSRDSQDREWLVVGQSMSDEEGLKIMIGRTDPLEAMRMARAVEERRAAV